LSNFFWSLVPVALRLLACGWLQQPEDVSPGGDSRKDAIRNVPRVALRMDKWKGEAVSRVFSVRTVLRQTPNRLIRQFLERLGHADLDIAWDELDERDIEPIVRALDTLTSTQLNRAEGALRTVFDLACDSGIAALLEAGELCGDHDLFGAMPEDAGLYERAMWA